MAYRFTTFTHSLPITIQYECPFCGENNCCKSTIKFKHSLPGHGYDSYPADLRQQLIYEPANREFSKKLSAISENRFDNTSFNVKCGNCDKSPAWSMYPDIKFGTIALFIIGVILLIEGISLLVNIGNKSDSIYIVFMIICSLPLVLILPYKLISRLIRNKKIASYTKKQLPTIMISQDKNEIIEDKDEEQKKVYVQDKMRCKKCGAVQNKGRLVCWECGARFIDEDGTVEGMTKASEDSEINEKKDDISLVQDLEYVKDEGGEKIEQDMKENDNAEETEEQGTIKERDYKIKEDMDAKQYQDILFCRYCGFKLLDNSDYCSHCGKKVK